MVYGKLMRKLILKFEIIKVKNKIKSIVPVRHFIPLQLDYDFAKDRYNTADQHFEKYFGSYDYRPIVLYVHGSTQDKLAILI